MYTGIAHLLDTADLGQGPPHTNGATPQSQGHATEWGSTASWVTRRGRRGGLEGEPPYLSLQVT